MITKNFEDLAIKYPLLFQKARLHDLEIGDGWIHIIDTLCAVISNHPENIQQTLAYEQSKPIPNQERIIELENELIKLIENLPSFTQIKEKFGGLRIYADGGTDEHHHYMRFAESIAYRTCEECGSPGESRNDGWVKTLCDRHHKERVAKTEVYRSPKKVDATKLVD